MIKRWDSLTLESLTKHKSFAEGKTYTNLSENGFYIMEQIPDSFFVQSGRGLFLSRLFKEHNLDTRNWVVIEYSKCGEVQRFFNYLIIHEQDSAHIFKYERLYNKWEKDKDYKEQFSVKDIELNNLKPRYGSTDVCGNNVTVTWFKDRQLIASEYFQEGYLGRSNKIAEIIGQKFE